MCFDLRLIFTSRHGNIMIERNAIYSRAYFANKHYVCFVLSKIFRRVRQTEFFFCTKFAFFVKEIRENDILLKKVLCRTNVHLQTELCI